MQCLFLFRDSSGRLPTAQELRACGFRVSKAVVPQEHDFEAEEGSARGLALAAEPRAAYGTSSDQAEQETAGA